MSYANRMNNVKQRQIEHCVCQLITSLQTDCASMKPSMIKLDRYLTLIPLSVFVHQDITASFVMRRSQVFTVGQSVARFSTI